MFCCASIESYSILYFIFLYLALKIMFSVVSVLPRLEGFFVTITHDTLDFTIQGTHPPPPASALAKIIAPPPPRYGHVQICSL